MQTIKVKVVRCLRVHRNGIPCGHVWVPRGNIVRLCPKCKSAKWDVREVLDDLSSHK